MRRILSATSIVCFLLSCFGAFARPQGGESWRRSPWWKLEEGSSASSIHPPRSVPETQQLSPHLDLDLRLGQATQLSHRPSDQGSIDSHALQHTDSTATRQRYTISFHPQTAQSLPFGSTQAVTEDVPMTLDEHQRLRQGQWHMPARTTLVRIGTFSTGLEHYRRPSGQLLQFDQPGTSAAPIILDQDEDFERIADHPSLFNSWSRSRYFPREAADGRFEFRSYNYDDPGLRHLMEPRRIPRSLIGHIHSSRGATKVYRPDPDVLRAIEGFIHDRVGNAGIFARLPNGEKSAYGSFLQPSLVEAESFAYHTQPIAGLKLLTIHHAAMDRANNAVSTLKRAAKTVYFPTINVGDVSHYIMAIPQQTKHPINEQRVSGVMFHFWEGLAPITYEPDFPSIRAYLGAMMLDFNHFDKWTDVPSLTRGTLASSLSHA